MTIDQWINIAAVIVGPLAAVTITLIWENVRRVRERRAQLLQTLMALRATPSNPWFTNAINTIPLEFAHHSEVLLARRDCLEINLPNGEMARRLDRLIWEIMKAIGLKVPASPTTEEIYIAVGLGEHEKALFEALKSLPVIAGAASRSAQASEAIVARMNAAQG